MDINEELQRIKTELLHAGCPVKFMNDTNLTQEKINQYRSGYLINQN